MANYSVKQLNFTKDGNTYTITGETYENKAAASGGTAVSLVTTGEKYNWNNKAELATATTSVNGLMSSTDKSKLDGIAAGATTNVGTITGITMNGSSKGTSGVVDLGGVITVQTGQAAGKYLQTNSSGEAVWGDAASASSVVSATQAWLSANVPSGTTIAVDRSLSVDGAAANAKTVGEHIGAVESAIYNDKGKRVSIPISVENGGIVNTNGSVEEKPASSSSYRYGHIDVDAGDIYTVTVGCGSSSTYSYYAFYTDQSGVILKSFIPGGTAGVFSGTEMAPAGAKKLYTMGHRNNPPVIMKHSSSYVAIDDADVVYMSMTHDEYTLPINAALSSVQNESGSVVINDTTTQYRTCIVPCQKGEKYKITVLQRHVSTSMANYPYYGFIVNSSLQILRSILAVDTTIETNPYEVTETISITEDSAAYLYIMSIDYQPPVVVQYSPYWKNTITDLVAKVEGEPSSQELADAGLVTSAALQEARTGLSFAFVTDTHSNGEFLNSDRTVKYKSTDSKLTNSVFRKVALSGMVDFGVHGGDIISAYGLTKADYTEELANCMRDYDGFRIPMLFVKGNHECNHETGWFQTGEDVTKTEYYSNVQRRDRGIKTVNPADPYGGYYYCDFPEYKIRVIVLNIYINPRENGITGSFGATQDAWFASALTLSGISDASKWGILVFCHPAGTSHATIQRLSSYTGPGHIIGLIHGHNTHEDEYDSSNGYNCIGVAAGYAKAGTTGNNRCVVDIFTLIPSVEGDNSNGIIYETRIGRVTSGRNWGFAFNWGSTVGPVSN